MNKRVFLEIAAMLNGFPQGSTDPDLFLRTIEADTRSLDEQAVIEACQRFRSGRVEGQNLDWPPSSAQFCAEARRINDLLPYRNRQALPKPAQERAFREDERAKARMRLKFPLFRVAQAKGELAKLAKANSEGVEAMIILAGELGVPVPEELYGSNDDEWLAARNRAWAEIERNPPGFMRKKPEVLESRGLRGFDRPDTPISRSISNLGRA